MTDTHQEGTEEGIKEKEIQKERNDVQPASFNEINAPSGRVGTEEKNNGSNNIERILDIPVTISVELGRTRMVINDLLQLGSGSVIELEKVAGEPMEVLVNDKLAARGEVVIVNEKFGVRLTDIVSPMERIKQLKK